MAELLIKALSATSADPQKDAALYKQGDVVVIMPDGHVWGSKETLPDFWRVRVAGVSPEDFAQALTRTGNRRRDFQFDRAQLPPTLRTQLVTNGFVTLTRGQAIACVKGKG